MTEEEEDEEEGGDDDEHFAEEPVVTEMSFREYESMELTLLPCEAPGECSGDDFGAAFDAIGESDFEITTSTTMLPLLFAAAAAILTKRGSHKCVFLLSAIKSKSL